MSRLETRLQLLRIEKITLLCSLEQQIEDINLMIEIRRLVGEDCSIPGLFGKLFRRGQAPSPEQVEKVGRRIEEAFPDAMSDFERLLEVCKRLQKHESTLIIF